MWLHSIVLQFPTVVVVVVVVVVIIIIIIIISRDSSVGVALLDDGGSRVFHCVVLS
jgi:preprotein translocase subunit SecG